LNTKLRCVLLDDELPGLTFLKMLCEQLPELQVIRAFNKPEAFLEELPNLEFDLCILDIEMPHIDGLQVARLLNGKAVIFTTAYKEYAAEAFDLDAVDYVRKPIQRIRLQQAVQRALNRNLSKSSTKNFIQLNTDKGRSIILTSQLLFIRASHSDARDKMAHLKNGDIRCLKNISFNTLREHLPSNQFIRINKQEMISRDIVQAYSFSQITSTLSAEPGKQLLFALSKIYRKDFLAAMGS
jgi:DNA-binding LytR/AlgR family response regulator